MDIVDSMKSALERIAAIPLDVSMWNDPPLFSKICFAAAAVLLVLYMDSSSKAGYSEGMRGMLKHSKHYADQTM